MFSPRSAVLVTGIVAAVAYSASAGAVTKPVTHKVKSGTTTLTFSAKSIADFQALGITPSAVAPATAAGAVLKFPVKAGTTVKTKGTNKIVSGTLVEKGGFAMAGATKGVTLSKLTLKFGAVPLLSGVGLITGTTTPLPGDIATVTIPASKTKITKKGMTVTGAKLKLTSTAAGLLNGIFSTDTFKAGNPIGTATMVVKFK